MMPDFLWRSAGLIVETDSRKVHGARSWTNPSASVAPSCPSSRNGLPSVDGPEIRLYGRKSAHQPGATFFLAWAGAADRGRRCSRRFPGSSGGGS
jgi:hypothetical protein